MKTVIFLVLFISFRLCFGQYDNFHFRKSETLLFDSTNTQLAIKEAHFAIHDGRKNNDSLLISNGYRLIGIAHLFVNQLDSSLIYLQEASQKCPLNAHKTKGLILYYEGIALTRMGLMEMSINNFERAQTCFVIAQDSSYLNSINNEIGKCYAVLEQYEEALAIFKKTKRTTDDSLLISILDLNLGNCLLELSELNEAEKYFQSVLQNAFLPEEDPNRTIAQEGIAKILIEKGSYIRAIELLSSLHSQTESSGDQFALAEIELELSRVYAKTGDELRSKEYLVKAERFFSEINNSEGILKVETYKSLIFQSLGQLDQALVSERKASQLRNQLRSERKEKLLMVLNLKSVALQKQSDQSLFSSNSSPTSLRWFIFLLPIALIAVVVVLGPIYFKKKSLNSTPSKSSEVNAQLIEISEQLLILMKTEKSYLDPNISVRNIAQKLNTNTTYLSKACNVVLKRSFSEIVNEHRINESLLLLSDERYSKYTIEAISSEVGFSSKSSFNNSFKKNQNCTPSEYKKRLSKKSMDQ